EPPSDSPLKYPRVIKIIRVTEEIEISSTPASQTLIERVKSRNNLRFILYKKIKISSVLTKTKVTRHDGIESSREIIMRKPDERMEEYLHLLDAKGRYAVETYNLTKAPKKKMVATAYYPGDPLAWRDGTVTYLGMKMQRGLVAVDPNVIPLRTRVWVPGYGYGYAADTGNAIKGNRIDLGVRNPQEEKSWMHRAVTVYILGKAKGF
ncbi:MAG: 3D domain-containing protein, partial [Endomicrobiia bacterium]|nr:3D domain-containing protein [Endomicrobiia bacterium]